MSVRWIALGIALAGLVLWACGPTIGDACTTSSDCGLGTCLQGPLLPGGYCSRPCGDAGMPCPNGAACIGNNCALRCSQGKDCRTGYTCFDAGSAAVCIGT